MKTRKTWGYEVLLHNGAYCCKLLVYTRRIASSLHYHQTKHETFYVASGVFHLEVEPPVRSGRGELGAVVRHYRELRPGDHVTLPPFTVHRVRCSDPGTIVEASTHDDPADCVRLEPSES